MPSLTDRPRLLGVLAVLSVLVLLYSLLAAQQMLLGLVVVLGFWFFYLVYLAIVVFARIATALERIADQRDAESGADEATRD